MSAPPVPTALASLAQRRGVSTTPWTQQGRLSLRIDARVRVAFMTGRRPQDVVLEARFGHLPTASDESEALIARVMLHATAGSAEQLATVVLSPDGRQLLLQAVLEGSDANRFFSGVETFLNELDRWITVVGVKKS